MGVLDTADRQTVTVDPLQPFTIGQEIYRINHQKYQLGAWLKKYSRYRPTESSRFGHGEKCEPKSFLQYAGADESSQATTGLSIPGIHNRCARGYRLLNCRTEEVIRLNADCTTDTTGAVKRNFGSSGTPLMKNGDMLMIMAPAKFEGDEMTKGVHTQEVWLQFTTSIYDWPVEMTGTKATERHIDGDPWAKALGESWDMAAAQQEVEVIWGKYVKDDATYTYPMHASQGLLGFISTHVYDIDGWLTRWDLWDIIAEMRLPPGSALACSDQMINLVNTWAFDKVTYNQDLVADGIAVQQIKTPKGVYDLLNVDVLSSNEYLAGMILFLPKSTGPNHRTIDYRPLMYNGNREIAYQPVESGRYDQKWGHIFGEAGYEFWDEAQFGVLRGVRF